MPVEGSREVASQTPIDVYSGDEGAHWHPKPHWQCMKDAEIMRQNARFRSSWEPGLGGDSDLITLVAAAAVVNGVIGHCRPSQI